MTRLTLHYAEDNPDFATQLPRTGTIVRAIPSKEQRDWQLLQLDSAFEYRGKPYGWLLIRPWNVQVDYEGGDTTWMDVLAVGADPLVGDEFDEASFASLGSASVQPVRVPLSYKQKLWLRWVVGIPLVAGAGWYLWDVNPEASRLVARLVFAILGGIK
jgi:hypothetical protein